MITSASVLFVAHGPPMFALQPGAAGAALAEFATTPQWPEAVLVISPHWEKEVATVGTAVSWTPSMTSAASIRPCVQSSNPQRQPADGPAGGGGPEPARIAGACREP